jgi:hypothetical protein
MGHFATRQLFQETPDGIRSLFSTRYPFVAGTVLCAQGSVLLDTQSYAEIAGQFVRFVDPATRHAWTMTLPGVCDASEHGLALNQIIVLGSSGALPGSLAAEVVYYAIPLTADTFAVAATAGGAALTFDVLTTETLWYATPAAPQVADGTLWCNLEYTIGATPDVFHVGVWDVLTWQAKYDAEGLLTLVQCNLFLQDAWDEVAAKLSAAVSTNMLSDAPNAAYMARIRQVQGDLACFLAQQMHPAYRARSSYSENYGGVASFSVSYTNPVNPALWTREHLLHRLAGFTKFPAELPAAEQPGDACKHLTPSGQFVTPKYWEEQEQTPFTILE